MSKITDLTAELARPVVEACGCTLWDVEYIGGRQLVSPPVHRQGGRHLHR